MKKHILYSAAMLMASAVFTACDYEKDFEQPPLEDYVPRAGK